MKLITNPNEFFANLKTEEISIRKPMVIVIALAVITAIQQFLMMTRMAEAFPAEVSRFFMVGAYTGIAGSFIGMFAVWLILAGVMHALSSLFGGNGSFRRTFEFTGYGYLPSLIGSLITVPMSLHYISQAEIPEISENCNALCNPKRSHLLQPDNQPYCDCMVSNNLELCFEAC